MRSEVDSIHSDRPLVLFGIAGILALSLFLQHEFAIKQALLFLIGIGLGISLLHAAFGFAGGWRTFIRDRKGAGVRAQLWLLAITSILFFPILGGVFPELKASAALGPVGISVLVGAFLFGIGMQLGGGCGSGTLFTVGGGHVRMLITLAFFIAGAVIGSVHLPWWLALPSLGPISIVQHSWLLGLLLQLGVLMALYMFVQRLERGRHGQLAPLTRHQDSARFSDRLIVGPWPLLWGVVALALLNLATLLLAGHPWSITFAFGLWGTKLWAALGGDISSWSYWGSGYPARALNQSVLADTTSLMDIGVILGAMLAAGLAGTFAPQDRLKRNDYLTAIVGGLLMGYGARLAFGCNIGGLLAGIGSGSLHGWLWLGAGFSGAVIGVRLRVWAGMDPKLEKPQ